MSITPIKQQITSEHIGRPVKVVSHNLEGTLIGLSQDGRMAFVEIHTNKYRAGIRVYIREQHLTCGLTLLWMPQKSAQTKKERAV